MNLIDQFDKLIKRDKISDKELFIVIKKEIKSIIKHDFSNIYTSLFELRAPELKLLLLSRKRLFWMLYNYLGKFNYDKESRGDIKKLNKDGILIKENFFSQKELAELKQLYDSEYKDIPPISELLIQEGQKYESTFRLFYKNKTIRYGNLYEGRTRIIYSNKNRKSKVLSDLMENKKLISVISKYYLVEDAYIDTAILEKINAPTLTRNDYNWHIDTLSDQCKIMIILKDMDTNSAPFTYVPRYHKTFTKRMKAKYHKMYKLGGLRGGYLNHFEDSSVTKKKYMQKAILKAGSVVFFDSRIQHSVSYAQNDGCRENITLYFNDLRTIRNRLLNKIDRYVKL